MLRFKQLEAIEVNHAVTTRAGGVSTGPFTSLNLGYHTGDDPGAVAENRRILCRQLGIDPEHLFFARQIHGCRVEVINGSHRPEQVSSIEADALISTEPRHVIGVLVADCLPILLADTTGYVPAAVHAGRRGIEKGIVFTVIDALTRTCSLSPDQFLACVGPGIQQSRYPVDSDTARCFYTALGTDIPVSEPSTATCHLDLRHAVHVALIRAGIPVDQIEHMDICTAEHTDIFYSHRAEAGVTGRFAAVIQSRSSGFQLLHRSRHMD
ncbi:laccase domain-containing protein [bacterium]|nr:laccase domain-containing protein [candidate division CSSED10-310 bacterium]